jgi:sialate O-acetylesterase
MIYPLTRMVVKGAIWYQGESNINYNRDAYTCTFSKMIETWRNVWHTRTNSTSDPTFPFGFVQVYNCCFSFSFDDVNYFPFQLATADPSGKTVGGFPWIRWHQTFDVGYVPNDKVPNVFMAVALDLRDDEHE